MALKVGELFATLKLDSKGFDDGLDQSKRSFDGLRTGLEKGTKAVATAFTGATVAAAGLGVAATKVGIEYNGLRQTATASLKTLTGSVEEAADQMDRLDAFGSGSWVMRDVLIRAQQQMTGFGIETQKVIPYLDGLQKGIAAAGKGNEEFSRAAEIMAEIQSTSKITGEHVRRLGLLGIDAADAIGSEMSKTGQEIKEAITEGSLDAGDALDALASGLATKFPDAVENVRNTWDGATANMAGAWRDFGAELARPLVDPEGGGYFVTWANDVANAFWALREKTGPVVDLLTVRFAKGLESVSPLLRSVKDTINDWDISKLNAQLDEMGRYAPLIAGTSAALFAMGSTSLPLIGRFLPTINPLVAGLGAMVAFSPELRAMGSDLLSTLSPLLPVAGELARVLGDAFMGALESLTPAIGDLLGRAGELAVTFGTALAPAVVGLLEASVPLVDVLASVVSWFADLPTPLLLTVAAFAALQGPLRPLTKMIEGVGLSLLQFGQRSAIHAALGDTNKAMGAMSVAVSGARGAVSRLGGAMKAAFISNAPLLAITALTSAFAAFATAQAEAKQRTDEYYRTLDEFGNRTAETFELINEVLAQDTRGWLDNLFDRDFMSAVDGAEMFGIALEDLQGYIVDEADAVERVNAALDAHVEQQGLSMREKRKAQAESDLFAKFLNQEADALSNAEKMSIRKREADEAAGIAQDGAREASESFTDAVKRQTDALNEQHDAQRRAAGEVLSASETTIRYNETVDRATKKIKENGETLDLNTEKGRENQSALNDLARAGLDNVDALRKNNASTKDLQGAMQSIRSDFIEQAKRAGASAKEAERLADNLKLIPGKYTATIDAKTSAAWAAIEKLRGGLSRLSGTVRIGGQVVNPGMMADGGVLTKRADGGFDEAGRYVPRVSQMVMGGRNILWGEPETGWESYISGKPSARQRNLAVMEQTARKLGGVFIRPMADGGTTGLRGAVAASSGALISRADMLAFARVVAVETAAAVERGSASGVSAGFAGGSSGVARFARMGG